MTLGPQFEQLKMLMTGKELKNRIDDSYDRRESWNESLSDMWERKEEESRSEYGHGGGVYESIKDNGLYPNTKVQLHHYNDNVTRVPDAHHRIAAAAALEEEGHRQVFFPVQHMQIEPIEWESGTKSPRKSNWMRFG